ncbi:MAG: CCA tRNA nucleotidyltransferase [Desulfomonile tiedjei]|nr:CCA tRNA nucleotidyltransferase [Desulfomonile tiedjei]
MGDISRAREILESIHREAPESYLVGGAVRDRLMGRPWPTDLDLAVPCNGFELARRLAGTGRFKATFVPLDSVSGTGRIVLHGDPSTVLDISSYKGQDIRDDLRHRDFTINAIAMTIPDFLEGEDERVVDSTSGIRDLQTKTIRACSGAAFEEDPLRIIRAFRFKASMDFTINADTLDLMPRSLKGLAAASPERIRDELIATLSASAAFLVLVEMDSMGIIDLLLPEIVPMKGCLQNEYHHLDVWDHTLEAVKQLEQVLRTPADYFADLSPTVEQYCNEEPVKGRQRSSLLKLATIFHDSGKPQTVSSNSHGRIHFFGHEKISTRLFEQAGLRLKLAGREIKSVSEIIAGHMRTLIFTRGPVTGRAVHRLCRHFKRDVTGLLVLFLADLSASRGPARPHGLESTTLERVHEALRMCLEAERERQPPFLNGREVMAIFGLTPGPYLGKILKKLDELQGEGEVRTRDEAVAATRAILNGQTQPGRTKEPQKETRTQRKHD